SRGSDRLKSSEGEFRTPFRTDCEGDYTGPAAPGQPQQARNRSGTSPAAFSARPAKFRIYPLQCQPLNVYDGEVLYPLALSGVPRTWLMCTYNRRLWIVRRRQTWQRPRASNNSAPAVRPGCLSGIAI